MATVQTFALCSVSVVDNVPPRTPVVRYVRENISHDILYASNGEQVISPSGLSGDLGNKQWKFVTVQEVSINSLMEKITAMEQKHSTDMELMGQRLIVVATVAILPLISNLSAQILLWLLARQPRNLKEANSFSRLNGVEGSRIRLCTDDMGDWKLHDFERDADSIISNRNISTHATTIEELDVMVEEARKLLQGSGLSGKVTPEIKVLNKYEIIRRHFPPAKYQGQTVAGGELDDSAQ